jgi:curli biogenesis system outer membrane secretion channel CsgG
MPSLLTVRKIARLAASAGLLGLVGCGITDTRGPTVQGFHELRKGTMLPVVRTVTNFESALRCMDAQLLTYGPQATILVEDLNDKTQKVPAGTTEMFLSAMSQMTRRSRAIKTVAFSDDTKNLTSYMLQAGTRDPFQPELVPTYTVRGAITQFDDNLVKKTVDGGFALGVAQKNFIGAGGSKSSSVNMLALDLTVVRAMDFSIVPGVNARNSAAILQEGSGIDGEANISKLGVNFMTSFSRSDGKSIAVRNLVELSAIELMGKLNKTPYWKCFGIDESAPEVINEIEDWHVSMTGGEKLAFYVRHFTAVGMLPNDGQATDPLLFKEAFKSYVRALGLKYTGQFSLEVFRAHFAADQAKIIEPALAFMEEELRNRLELNFTPLAAEPQRDPLQLQFNVLPNTDSNLYCYLQDEAKNIFRIFPNRWQRSAGVVRQATFGLPESGTFRIRSHQRVAQSVMCVVAREALDQQLPDVLRGADLEPLEGVQDLSAVANAYAATGVEQVVRTAQFRGAGAGFVMNVLRDAP